MSVTGLNHFYYVRDFSDMRCKHSRVLSIIREQLHREPNDGDVFIVMSRTGGLCVSSPMTTVHTAFSKRSLSAVISL